jgi:hypothetical protein
LGALHGQRTNASGTTRNHWRGTRKFERFFVSLKKLDDFLASSEPLQATPDKLLQAPIADALTHVGQIAMLRRLAGDPLKGENYYKAEIVAGRVGADQAKPKLEF